MRELLSIALFAAVAAVLPLVVSSGFLLNVAIMTLYATLLGISWNILAGFGGQFSFGHAVFFGTGAYAVAVLQVAPDRMNRYVWKLLLQVDREAMPLVDGIHLKVASPP